jgi:mRNA interferase HigB
MLDFATVRIIALSTLKAFVSRSSMHADARDPVMAWYRQIRGADWATPADVKRAIRSASILKDGRAVFNIAGNKYRIVVWINYPYRVVYVRFVGTHRQYDRIDAQTV